MGGGGIVNKDKFLKTLRDLEKNAVDNAERLADAGDYERALRQQVYAEAFTIVEQIVKDMEDK